MLDLRVSISKSIKKLGLLISSSWIENVINLGCEILDSFGAWITTLLGSVEDVKIESSEVLNGVDNSWRGPGSNSMVWVNTFEPSGKSSGVASSDDNPLVISTEFWVSCVNEMGNISQGLSSVEPLEILIRPSIFGKWLGGSIVPVLKSK